MSDAARAWLQMVGQFDGDPLGLVTKLRKALTPLQSHLVAEQAELRRRAKRKFGMAERMLFTRIGLEQATGESLGTLKAERFARFGRVADLCCGIGGDLLSLARVATTCGYDRDPVIAQLCEHNLAACKASAQVSCVDACDVGVADCDAWHIDPDRRASGARTIEPSSYSPTLAKIAALIARNPNAGIKLAPATKFASPVEVPYELQWLGQGRECQQQVAWFGELAVHPGKRSVAVLDARGNALGEVVGGSEERAPRTALRRYLIEPHPAVIAAGLVGTFAQEHQLTAIDREVAYLTADQPSHACGAGCFEVLVALPFDERALRAELKMRNLSPVEIKKRVVRADPRVLSQRLRRTGDNPCTLILTPLDGQVCALITERVTG